MKIIVDAMGGDNAPLEIVRGALDARARRITQEMKAAAVYAIAGLIPDEELSAENIIPKAFDPRVGPAVAEAVASSARDK